MLKSVKILPVATAGLQISKCTWWLTTGKKSRISTYPKGCVHVQRYGTENSNIPYNAQIDFQTHASVAGN